MGLDFDVRRDFRMAFATPILQTKMGEAAEINPGLKRAILDRETAEPGSSRSNVGGWHSRGDFLTWDVPEIAPLAAAMEEGVGHMTNVINHPHRCEIEQEVAAWANVSRTGSYHAIHTHPKHHWSGVYYVDAGAPASDWPRSGTLEFQDPRGCVDMAGTPGNPFGRTIAVKPVSGLLVLFPSWLYHWVNPYQGAGERVSISFNSRITKFRVLDGEAGAPGA